MMRSLIMAPLIALLVIAPSATAAEPAGIKKAEVDEMVGKGLEWLKRQQHSDGSWTAPGGQHPTTMTALAGMAMLMEGSTLREGKYSDQLVKAVDWFLKGRQQQSGLLVDPSNPTEGGVHIYGHGFGMMFLASVYGEEDDVNRRKKLEKALKIAVQFSGKAQTDQGGWGYVSAKEGGGFDEGSTTITQLQGLRAARNAGITVPKEIIDKATEYLRKCTTPRGGLIYNLGRGQVPQAGAERPAITAAACACAFSSGNYEDKYAKMWIKYCIDNIYMKQRGGGLDDYQTYYLAQVIYVLGDDRYYNLFPDEKKGSGIEWTKYKEDLFAYYKRSQGSDGGWGGGGGWGSGPIFATATVLTILQLEKGTLPIYHR